MVQGRRVVGAGRDWWRNSDRTLTAYAHGGMRMMWQNSGPHGHSVKQVRERVADGAAWVVGTVDATPEQKVAIKTIMSATVDDVYPLMQLHRGNRRELITLLAKPQMDADAVEQLRRSELQVFDAASKRLADALTKASTVLTPEQRQQLVAMAAVHRH